MKDFSATPRELAASLWRNRGLIKASIKREVQGRYRGSVMGMFWSLLNPLFMLMVYTFVFSVVFKARWSTGSDSKTEFALVLFAGLLVFNLFAECVNRASSLIVGNQNYATRHDFALSACVAPILLVCDGPELGACLAGRLSSGYRAACWHSYHHAFVPITHLFPSFRLA
jgi:lipopolysaccharide transport system permease protein